MTSALTVRPRKRRSRPALIAIAVALVALLGFGAQPAHAEPTPVEISVSAEAFAPVSPGQIDENEFLYDSSKGDDATGPNAGYQISYRGVLQMEKVWSSYANFRNIWLLLNKNDSARWKAKTFSGTWQISFTVDPTVVSYNSDLMNCVDLQQTIIEQNPDTTLGEIIRCDPADPTAVTYDAATGVYTAKFRLVHADGRKVTGDDLDVAASNLNPLQLTTPTGALYVMQSAFESDKTFLMTQPRVSGELSMDAFYIGMPLTFDATGNDVPLTMVTTYDSHFEFASTTSGRELPAEVLALLPATTTMHRTGAELTPDAPAETSIREGQGAWQFDGWSPTTQTVGTENVTFVGNWSYVVDPGAVFDVSFDFVSDSEAELPAEVLALLPGAGTAVQGTTVSPPLIAQRTVQTDEGTWTFDGWSPESATVAGADLVFTGTWSYRAVTPPDPKELFAVDYTFTSASDAALPAEVLAFLPAGTTALDGTLVTPPTIAQHEVTTEAGTWAFGGWSPESATVAGANLVFTAAWAFTPVNPPGPDPKEFFAVDYAFTSATDAKLPGEVLALLPASTTAPDGTFVTPPVPERIAVTTDAGTWAFGGWTPESATVAGADLEFTAAWTLTPAVDPVKPTPTSPTTPKGGQPGSTVPALAATGSAGSSMLFAAGGSLLLLGLVALAVRAGMRRTQP